MSSMKNEVNLEIDICEQILATKDKNRAKRHIEVIVHTYGSYIDDISSGLETYAYYENNPDYIADIELLKRKLELFKANECTPVTKGKKGTQRSNVNIVNNNDNSSNNQLNNSNSNNIELEFNQLFSIVREEIENSSSLSYEDIQEALERLGKIEEVQQSTDNKNKKWFKLRETLSWMSTKGVDIGLKLMPLIIKSLENQ